MVMPLVGVAEMLAYQGARTA